MGNLACLPVGRYSQLTRRVNMSSATKDQQLPMDSNGPDIINLVKDDLESRAVMGVETYGKRLQPHNGRNALIDAYQEVLDLSVYVKQRLVEEESFIAKLNGAIDEAKATSSEELVGLEQARNLYLKIVGC